VSGLILVCLRDPAAAPDLSGVLQRCAARLVPDNITPRPPAASVAPGIGFIVTSPTPDLAMTASAACVGVMAQPAAAWHRPGATPPDGCYALLRHDEGSVEVVSDALASRTVWYAQTPQLFLASTSQRALVSLLGRFDPDPAAVTWMATSGTLGPSASWDRRLRRLPGASRLTLERRTWRLSVSTDPVVFEPSARGDDALVRDLGEAIVASCAGLRLDLSRWVLPLSGGLNSRGLLVAFLQAGQRPRCVTWGLSSSLDDPKNDAYIARLLAQRVGLEHRYYPTDHSSEPIGRVLDRYLAVGEGRTEDFGAYTDGLATWRELHESGVAGVIRGDEPGWGFGSYYSEEYARRKLRLRIISDYSSTHLIQRLGLEPQPVPPGLRRRDGETFATYNDRVDDTFLVPTRFAALNDVKAPYVEIANPLLTRNVVSVARTLPDHLRRERGAFESWVQSLAPAIPYAEHHAPADPDDYLGRDEFLAELRRELGSSRAEAVLEPPALEELLRALDRPSAHAAKRKLRDTALRMVPVDLARRVRRNPALLLSVRELAFRIAIASRMAAMLRADGAASHDIWGLGKGVPGESAGGAAPRLRSG
jgi:hypothetical protein